MFPTVFNVPDQVTWVSSVCFLGVYEYPVNADPIDMCGTNQARLVSSWSNIERTTTHDMMICGIRIPRGTDVSVCPIMACQDVQLYGPDVEAFRPERWIEAT